MKAPKEFSQIPGGGHVLLSSHSSISWQCIPKIKMNYLTLEIKSFLSNEIYMIILWFSLNFITIYPVQIKDFSTGSRAS